MMDHMERIRGKLFAGDGAKVLLEDVEGYIGSHPRRDGSKVYFGFFGFPPEKRKGFDADATYRLVLDDGRSGDIYADVHPSQTPGQLVAEFHVDGSLN
jgi:hypothetical protein